MTARTTKSRTLGAALRKAREERGLTLREFAKMIRQDQGVLSRWENGERIARPENVAQILTTLGVTDERYDDLVAIARDSEEPHWAATTLPERRRQMMALQDCEQKATRITDVSPLLIPGLLQTPAYTRATMESDGLPPDEISERVGVRANRQHIVTREDPVHLRAVIGSSALINVIGSTAVMSEQLRLLLGMAKRPNVEIRVLPANGGWTPALEGPIYLMEFEGATPIVLLENRKTGLFLHERSDVDEYRSSASRVLEAALSCGQSIDLIAKMLRRMGQQ